MSAVARVAWRVLGALSALVAAKLARSLLDHTWRGTTGTEPPRNPAAPGTTWTEALVWASASGVALGVSRLLATRGAAAAWEHSTGSLPPGLEQVGA